ncbi:MAG: glycosyl hydrolase family 18 protein [Acidobacteria bacterium]|nr:glycosyl hydrolase family 18 protein [Acidobacteriota bacterium]
MFYLLPLMNSRRLWSAAALTLLLAWTAAAEPPIRQFYFLNDAKSWKSLEENGGTVNLLSPVWFSVTRTGTLESSMDLKLIEWAAEKKIPVMPVLVNQGFDPGSAHALIGSRRVQETVIATLLRIAALRGFKGIQLDFESFAVSDRDGYTQFVERFARALHNLHMQLSVAVMSPYGAEPQDGGGWTKSTHAAAFDYFQLGTAADFITLMAYDQHTAADKPGPIAGLPWAEACVQKLLEVVPSSKLLLGIPLYYRRWGRAKASEGPFHEAQALAARHQAKILRDGTQAESMFRFEDGEREQVVWFSNAADLRRRMELIGRYRLRGYSAWRLGQEDPEAWRLAFPPGAGAN